MRRVAILQSMNAPPDAECLFQRIRVLFGVVPADHAVPAPSTDSPYSVSAHIESFDVGIPDTGLRPDDPAKAAAAWLNTPNPTFGGLCPKTFIDSTDDQRAFLDGVLSSLEEGAFS